MEAPFFVATGYPPNGCLVAIYMFGYWSGALATGQSE